MQVSARADTAAAPALSGLQPQTVRERENSPAKPEHREQPEGKSNAVLFLPLFLLEGNDQVLVSFQRHT